MTEKETRQTFSIHWMKKRGWKCPNGRPDIKFTGTMSEDEAQGMFKRTTKSGYAAAIFRYEEQLLDTVCITKPGLPTEKRWTAVKPGELVEQNHLWNERITTWRLDKTEERIISTRKLLRQLTSEKKGYEQTLEQLKTEKKNRK